VPDTSLVSSESTPQGSVSSFKLTAHVASAALRVLKVAYTHTYISYRTLGRLLVSCMCCKVFTF